MINFNATARFLYAAMATMLAVALIVPAVRADASNDIGSRIADAGLCRARESELYSPPSIARVLRILSLAQLRRAGGTSTRAEPIGSPIGVYRTTVILTHYVPPEWFVRRLERDYSANVVRNNNSRTRSIVIRDTASFGSAWRTQFDPAKTRDDVFFAKSGPARRPFMRGTVKASYLEDKVGQYVFLPYENGSQLQLGLPRGGQAVCSLAAHMRSLRGQFAKMDDYLIRLPRVDIEVTRSVLDLVNMFSPRLLVMTALPESPIVTQIYQRSSIAIREGGTVANTETVAKAEPVGLPMFRKLVNFNHPFAFRLIDRLGGVAFEGEVL